MLKPGGLLLQTMHMENVWAFYHRPQKERWARAALPEKVWGNGEMDLFFLYHGDIGLSQVF